MSNAPQTLCGGCLSPTVRPKSPPKKPVSSRGCPCGANAHSATATGELCPNSAREPTTARAAPPAAGIRTGHRYTNTIQRRMAHPSSADRRRCGWAGPGTTRKVRCLVLIRIASRRQRHSFDTRFGSEPGENRPTVSKSDRSDLCARCSGRPLTSPHVCQLPASLGLIVCGSIDILRIPIR